MGPRKYVSEHPYDARAWRLLSFAEEMLLAHPQALAAFERALVLVGTGDKGDLKRLGILRTAVREWTTLGLTPEQVGALRSFLKDKLATGHDHDDLRWTEAWLKEHGFQPESIAKVLAAFRERGVFTDEQAHTAP